MAQRRGVGGRLLTRNGNDWTERYPSVVAALYALKVKSCLIDVEITVCENGLPFAPTALGAHASEGLSYIQQDRCHRPQSGRHKGYPNRRYTKQHTS